MPPSASWWLQRKDEALLDLWGKRSEQAGGSVERVETLPPPPTAVRLKVAGDTITLASPTPLEGEPLFPHLFGVTTQVRGKEVRYQLPLRALNAYLLRHFLKKHHVMVTPEEAKSLTLMANKITKPQVRLASTGKHVEVLIPPLEPYQAILRMVNGYPVANGGYRVALTKVLDLEALSATLEDLPPLAFTREVHALVHAPIPGFDGTVASLKTLPLSLLNVVAANSQSYKSLSKSRKTLEEKMASFGLATLHDLMHFLPRRYIDKSAPQDLRDLMVDEPATIVGRITSVGDLPKSMGVVFTVETSPGNNARAIFWRQHWLKTKFKVGQEVLITGKFGLWNKRPQLGGSSIEDAKEAELLPVVPIYKQSESRGVTSAFILAAQRELFARLGPIALPSYLQGVGRVDYYEAFKELHLPTTLRHHEKVVDSLAYYELVYMQLVIQEAREATLQRRGVMQEASGRNLQEKVRKILPFTLTQGQETAVARLNESLAGDRPTTTLLNAEVGSGKTLVGQMAALRAVEAGQQVAVIGPTEILARQLYETFKKLVDGLAGEGEEITLAFYNGSMKAAEKRALQAQVTAGEVDILVGTSGIMGEKFTYKSLGLVVVDEQQKFGAEQRSSLLTRRKDGLVPDLLMQTATPIPRSTAQVFYGDVDMILLKDRPPGRLPIVTEWLREDPQEVLQQSVNHMWADILQEAEAGNQTFVITPLVRESTTVDAASVERSYEALKEGVFPGLRVAHVHGQMKGEEQAEVMAAFREKKYDILVSSLVVEVGVDIPDATRVVILSADRLGASSLHQIRGRVGRNSKPSRCYLVSLGLTESSEIRLQSLVDSDNGFEVAKVDLKSRGEGKIFGVEQSGASEMVFASLRRHGKWVAQAKEEARSILAGPHRDEALRDAYEKFEIEGRLM